ncbi:hypothetical protein GCM10029976_059090 [Kribbella albertanoniae]|uniref:DUF8175 domain-containing protein n=1 Tax=Kribbella albertanoniae TaxID=1266829 RepID=A0A4R4QGY8_9ACTN|nr:hypothetical protein [Kribbella albertanoniae]TDC34800.1 hypothetical protein E1261_02535 [Kribbella albertanoniae]
MSENESTTPFGAGFVAACIVIAAVITCGLVVLFAGTADSPKTSLVATAPAATPDPTTSRSTCSLPAGDQGVPAVAPAVDGWEVSRRVVVPRSTAFGPGVVDSDGFRRCFAHSPTGAVFAAYNVLAALGDQTKATATARKLMLPGPDTDELLRTTAKETSATTSEPTQLAGYRVLAASRDQVTVTVAVPVETQYMSLTVTMVWHDHDWRLQPPPSGAAIGAPFAQVRNLADFVKWSGL